MMTTIYILEVSEFTECMPQSYGGFRGLVTHFNCECMLQQRAYDPFVQLCEHSRAWNRLACWVFSSISLSLSGRIH